MIDEGIHEKDLVIIDKSVQIKNGDIGAFLINNTEGTIKFLRNIEGKSYLVPCK
jgi:SOS-response transcriptional repressor LexA